jgi:hypothetical protein
MSSPVTTARFFSLPSAPNNVPQIVRGFILFFVVALFHENHSILLSKGSLEVSSPGKIYASSEKDGSRLSLPFCQSGNDYLSLEQGGQWLDTHVLWKAYDADQLWGAYHPHLLCYQQTGYSDTFQWQPPCRPLPSPFLDSIAPSSTAHVVCNDHDRTI